MAGASELFAERGFERTTVEWIAAAADISRRTFFRYFADKEELFVAEDERLLAVIDETLDGAPAGELALGDEPARRLAKTLRWEQAIAARLVARGSSEQEALLAPKIALAGLTG